jgi:hypothetical protein
LKRKIRRGIEISMPLLCMGIIFGSVLFGPPSLQLQVFLALIGVLILKAGVWGLTSGLLPSDRRYSELRAGADHFLGLVRILNQAAVGRYKGEEDDRRFRNTRTETHNSGEHMGELAGRDALAKEEPFTEVEAVVTEAAEVALAEAKAKQTVAKETPAEPADHELDPATPNA